MRLFSILLLVCIPFLLSAQLYGIIRDDKGEPLPFASVYVRNSTNGTIANADGEYRLPLSPGSYEMVFQYVGYVQRIEKVTIADKPVKLNIKLADADYQLGEVVITNEDPAIGIMRQAIAKRSYYKSKIADVSYDVYIKGFYKLKDAPKKIMGQDVGNMGGVLDSTRSGVVYLSESVSKVYSQKDPERKKEIMMSSKISGSSNGFSLNRATYTDFNLYEEKLNIDRDILSPLADNAFNYYNFKFRGEYKDQNGFSINKIEVIPKRSNDPTFAGFIYIVDDWWNIAGANLWITGNTIKQPVLDTLRIRQEFVLLQQPDTWCIITQNTGFKFGIFGFKFDGFFNSVFSGYELNPKFPDDLFGKEGFRIDKEATEKDSAYWQTVRPVPLTTEESRDYVVKDSLQKIWESKPYLDSTDHRRNKFEFMDLLMGYSWQNSWRHIRLEVPGAFRWVQFNTVQGWLINIEPTYVYREKKTRGKVFRMDGSLNYGFSEQKLRGSLGMTRRFNAINYQTLRVEGGIMPRQFDKDEPIGVLTNAVYSLWGRQNYMKLYEKSYGRVEWSQVMFPELSITSSLEYAQRAALTNHSDFSWSKSARTYTDNAPVGPQTTPEQPFFETSQALTLNVALRLKLGRTYDSYPEFRSYQDGKWPDFILHYRKAIPGVLGSDANFDELGLTIAKDDIKWGLAGYTDLRVTGAAFLNNKRVDFMDRYHPNGNQTILGKPSQYRNSFLLMPYYDYSTDDAYLEFHAQHHLQGWLIDKVPGLRKLNIKEVFGASAYYAPKTAVDQPGIQSKPWWELNAGFENIGIKAFRMFRIDVATSFYGTQYQQTRLIIGVDL